ncbi:MAG: CvpA family protein [Sulfurimonas sp.]|nr:CvpA family protein [Sulfurimonas sp.]
MEFNYFDIIVTLLVLFLGLKGVINGFFKELFGLIGIIGGIFIASRVGESVGQIISDSLLKFQSSAAISFTGFLVTLALFWLFMIGVGLAFKKLSLLGGLGIFDKTLGFIFSAGKFFLIAGVILYSIYNIKAIRPNLDKMMHNSMLFPVLVEIGGIIMKLDPVKLSSEINATVSKNAQAITKDVQESALKMVEDTKSKIDSIADKNISNEEKR